MSPDGSYVSALILAMTSINIVGVIWGGRMQLVTTVLKVGFLVIVAFAPLLCAMFVGPIASPSHFASAPPTAPGATTIRYSNRYDVAGRHVGLRRLAWHHASGRRSS